MLLHQECGVALEEVIQKDGGTSKMPLDKSTADMVYQ